jgi:hypothetical protein
MFPAIRVEKNAASSHLEQNLWRGQTIMSWFVPSTIKLKLASNFQQFQQQNK